jgi:putative proteasome-type protease
VINLLDYQTRGSNVDKTVHNASSMLDIANLVGDALREVHRRDGPYLQQSNIDSNASFIVGGQIRNEPQRLFNIYSEGNFIEATPETPYFQIGESKYAKPMLDRVINRGTHLLEAAKCVLVSFDSTMRSNISVGLPLDVVIYDNNSLKMRAQRVISVSDAYFKMIHTEWGEGLRRVFAQLPNPDWIRDSVSDVD